MFENFSIDVDFTLDQAGVLKFFSHMVLCVLSRQSDKYTLLFLLFSIKDLSS